jgi:hypothetical protein
MKTRRCCHFGLASPECLTRETNDEWLTMDAEALREACTKRGVEVRNEEVLDEDTLRHRLYSDAFGKDLGSWSATAEDTALFFLYLPSFTTHLYWLTRYRNGALLYGHFHPHETVFDVAKRVLAFLQHARSRPFHNSLHFSLLESFFRIESSWMTHFSVSRNSRSFDSRFNRQ